MEEKRMTILVVDDEAVQREMLQGFLQKRGYKVLTAANGEEALDLCARYPINLVLMDLCMPGMNGDEVLERLRESNPLLRVVLITAFGSVETAVKVMKLGACDFLEKPVDLTELSELIERHAQQLLVEQDLNELEEDLEDDALPLPVAAHSEAMQHLLSLVRRVARSPWTVLIHGETGTGKERIARLLHQLSERRDGPFVEVNCAALPENLFESELFGHEKGSFTGATSRRSGRFEAAQGGTLFLDEIGELPLAMQAKLLRALQEKRICPVGAERERDVDARVVVATNCDLPKMVQEGRFREDLYYRLNVFEMQIPPLRQRREDIPQLIDHFLDQYSLRPTQIEPAALDALIKYDYPGNVRELEHMIQRLATLVRGSQIRRADLPSHLLCPPQPDSSGGLLSERVEAVERQMLLETLRQYQGVQTRAAEALGISERVLRYKMAKYNLTKDAIK
jgi:two-component system response regulator AtoC